MFCLVICSYIRLNHYMNYIGGWEFMKYMSCGLIVLFAVLLMSVQGVSALSPDDINIHTDKGWLIAGSSNPAENTATVTVTNSSPGVISVKFDCPDSDLGSIAPSTANTPSYITQFTASTKSGTAEIRANVTYTDDGTESWVIKSVNQKIDHNTPYRILSTSYEREITVGEMTDIIVVMTDKYGNRIDSLREDDGEGSAEYINMFCTPKDCGFQDGAGQFVNKITGSVNEDGEVRAIFKASSIAGLNMIQFDPHYSLPSGEPWWITITGIGEAEPYFIDVVSVSPDTGDGIPYVPADGAHMFILVYRASDRFGNPSGNVTVEISSSEVGIDTQTFRTNSDGKICITYGPCEKAEVVTLTAIPHVNQSISATQDLEFVSTDPTDMVLTANPQSMVSHDVDNSIRSTIRAKVIDTKGNPVSDETVEFSIDLSSYVYPSSESYGPVLESNSAITNSEGYAEVIFVPGGFDEEGNQANSSASCDVIADWNDTTCRIKLEWKNYPYLSVETEVDPETVVVNETVDITVTVIGNGYALYPDPIDVVLAMDKSGSAPELAINNASKIFVGEMDAARDRAGVLSYRGDYTYLVPGDYPGITLTNDLAEVISILSGTDTTGPTSTRLGLFHSIRHLVDNPPPNSSTIRAVILMSGHSYTKYGDPLARGESTNSTDMPDDHTVYYYFSELNGSEQNLSVYAGNNNVRVYCISFGDPGDYTSIMMDILANSTGGFHEYASSDAAFADIYRRIAGDLKTEAGVNTSMTLAFDTVEINNVTYDTVSESVLDYVYQPGVSTTIESWNDTATIIPKYTVDDSADWADDHKLNFNVGTIQLGQTWETTFRLRVLKDGNINLFGPGSEISFNNNTDMLILPDTYITAVANLTANGTSFKNLEVSNLHPTNTGEITGLLSMAWHLNYTGNYTVTENVAYQRKDGMEWIISDEITVPGPFNGTQTSRIVVQDLAPGEYMLRVHASSPDTSEAEVEYRYVRIKLAGLNYIRIE